MSLQQITGAQIRSHGCECICRVNSQREDCWARAHVHWRCCHILPKCLSWGRCCPPPTGHRLWDLSKGRSLTGESTLPGLAGSTRAFQPSQPGARVLHNHTRWPCSPSSLFCLSPVSFLWHSHKEGAPALPSPTTTTARKHTHRFRETQSTAPQEEVCLPRFTHMWHVILAKSLNLRAPASS